MKVETVVDDEARYKHTEVGGVAVVGDEVMLSEGLSRYHGYDVPFSTIRVLTLADETVTYGCRDCAFTGTRGEVRSHRSKDHEQRASGRRANSRPDAEDEPASLPYPNAAMRALTVGELLEFSAHVAHWEVILGHLTDDRDQWKERCQRAERELRGIRRTLGRLVPAQNPGDGD